MFLLNIGDDVYKDRRYTGGEYLFIIEMAEWVFAKAGRNVVSSVDDRHDIDRAFEGMQPGIIQHVTAEARDSILRIEFERSLTLNVRSDDHPEVAQYEQWMFYVTRSRVWVAQSGRIFANRYQ